MRLLPLLALAALGGVFALHEAQADPAVVTVIDARPICVHQNHPQVVLTNDPPFVRIDGDPDRPWEQCVTIGE